MKSKKLLAFALSMAVAAGCTACGGGQASTDTSAAGSSDSTRQKAVPPATIPLSLPWVPVSPLWIQVMFTKSTHS